MAVDAEIGKEFQQDGWDWDDFSITIDQRIERSYNRTRVDPLGFEKKSISELRRWASMPPAAFISTNRRNFCLAVLEDKVDRRNTKLKVASIIAATVAGAGALAQALAQFLA